MQSSISVIIATYHRPAALARALEALEHQRITTGNFEVVVALDGPDVPTEAVLAEFASRLSSLRWVVGTGHRGPAATRNLAVGNSRAPLIAVTDDDCEPAPGWLEAFLRAFEQDALAGVLIGRTETEDFKLTPFSHYVRNQAGEGHQTCNIAYRRAVLEALGGFDERFPSAYLEDTELYCRAQEITVVRFVSEALVLHPPRELRVPELARSARKYESDFVFYAKHPKLYRRRHRGHGPLFSVLWYVACKFALKRLLEEAPWLFRDPALYVRYVVAMAGFVLLLFWNAPRYWLRHRLPLPSSCAAADTAG